MWKKKLEELRKEAASYGDYFKPGINDQEAELLQENFSSKFGHEIPEEYFNFLKYINGFEFNGCMLFGADQEFLTMSPQEDFQGLIEENEEWFFDKDIKDSIYLGDTGLSWYVYNIEEGYYEELDCPSSSLNKRYKDLYEMIEDVIVLALGE